MLKSFCKYLFSRTFGYIHYFLLAGYDMLVHKTSLARRYFIHESNKHAVEGPFTRFLAFILVYCIVFWQRNHKFPSDR